MEVMGFSALSISDQALVTAAVNVQKHAYAPYSGFKVGAAVAVRNYRGIFIGCNVENCVYKADDAERVAIAAMVTEVGVDPKPILETVAVALISEDQENHAFPCGSCLQQIGEFGDGKTRIIGACIDKSEVVWRVEIAILDELLPKRFTNKNLGR